MAIAAKKAVSWLERNMDLIELKGQAFDTAIVAYALMKIKASVAERAYVALSKKYLLFFKSNQNRREYAFVFCRATLEGGLVYFARQSVPQPPFKMENQRPFLLPRLPYEYDSENIEATAYALMIYVERQELWVDNIVR